MKWQRRHRGLQYCYTEVNNLVAMWTNSQQQPSAGCLCWMPNVVVNTVKRGHFKDTLNLKRIISGSTGFTFFLVSLSSISDGLLQDMFSHTIALTCLNVSVCAPTVPLGAVASSRDVRRTLDDMADCDWMMEEDGRMR